MSDPTRNPTDDDERILDLLTERLERPLADDEKRELDRLLRAHPQWRKSDLDFAAAAVHLALEPGLEPMPEAVKARVIAQLVGDATRPPLRLASTQDTGGGAVTTGSGKRISKPSTAPAPITGNTKRPPRARSPIVFAPWVAAAAAVVVAVVGWWPRIGPDPGRPGLEAQRIALAQDPTAQVIKWAPTEDPLGKAVSGDVVWSGTQQQGFMRFAGLPQNDPTKSQYQLWVFDAERDERYPVDGGVFDIKAGGEAIVPINVRVPVGKVVLFAVTLEKPGGVVVSTRERLVALGKVG